jgi:hypothetical protein
MDNPFTGLYRVSNSDCYSEPYRLEAIAELFGPPILNVFSAYNMVRPHSAIGILSVVAFEAQATSMT